MGWSPVAGSPDHALWSYIAYFKQVGIVLVSEDAKWEPWSARSQPTARSWLCVMRISHHLSIA